RLGGGGRAGGGTTSRGASHTGGSPNLGGDLINGGGSSPITLGGDSTTTTFGGDGNMACAATSAEAQLAPVYLVFLLDESGSMGDGKNGDRKVKWDPVTSALES